MVSILFIMVGNHYKMVCILSIMVRNHFVMVRIHYGMAENLLIRVQNHYREVCNPNKMGSTQIQEVLQASKTAQL